MILLFYVRENIDVVVVSLYTIRGGVQSTYVRSGRFTISFIMYTLF